MIEQFTEKVSCWGQGQLWQGNHVLALLLLKAGVTGSSFDFWPFVTEGVIYSVRERPCHNVLLNEVPWTSVPPLTW